MTMATRFGLAIVAALTAAAGMPAVPAWSEPAHEANTEAANSAHEWHRNHIGLFIGGAHREKHDEDGWVLEAEYEFRPFRHVGFGAVVEHTFEVEGDPWLLVLPVTLHPIGGWRLYTGPGFEWEDGNSAEFGWRIGTGWDFELPRNFVLTPAVNADWVDSHWNFSYGIQLGYAF